MMIQKMGFSPQKIKFTPRFASTENERHMAFIDQSISIPDVRWTKTTYRGRPEYSEGSVVQTESIVWDSEHHCFFERYEKFHQEGFSQNKSGETAWERKIMGNYVLESGVYVDSTNQRLILPNGTWIDGPTGILHNIHGQPHERKKSSESKDV